MTKIDKKQWILKELPEVLDRIEQLVTETEEAVSDTGRPGLHWDDSGTMAAIISNGSVIRVGLYAANKPGGDLDTHHPCFELVFRADLEWNKALKRAG